MSTEDTEFKDEETKTSYKEEKVFSVRVHVYAVFSLCVCTQSIPPQQIKQPLSEYILYCIVCTTFTRNCVQKYNH